MLCRICVREVDVFISLYDLYYGNVPARLFIEDIFKIDISNNHQKMDSQDVICATCNKILNLIHQFHQAVKEAQHKYQQINNFNLENDGSNIESVDVSDFENEIKMEIEDYVEVNNSNDTENNTSNVTDNLEWNVPLVNNLNFENRIEDFVLLKNRLGNPKFDLNNVIEKTYPESQLEKENDRLALKEKILFRIENATNKINAKYKIEEIFHKGEWLLSDDQKEEMLSLFVEMKCCKCKLSNFPNYKDLYEHAMKEHGEVPKIICCDCYTSNIEDLQTHILYKHILKKKPPKKYKNSECPVCHVSISNRIRLQHLSTHLPHDKRNYQCDQCHAGFHAKGKLNAHIKAVHSKSEVTCDECGKTYANEHILKHHKANVHCPLAVLCPECGVKFKSIGTLNSHIKHKHSDKKVKCHICNAVLRETSLRQHIQQHDENNKKQCPHCPHKAFNITNHIKTVHKKIKPFACTMCPMKFGYNKALNTHMASRHTGVPQYSCEFCEKTFMSSGNYCSHRKRMHKAELAQKKLETVNNINNTDKIVLVEKTERRHIVQDDEVESLKETITNTRRIKPKE